MHFIAVDAFLVKGNLIFVWGPHTEPQTMTIFIKLFEGYVAFSIHANLEFVAFFYFALENQ